jgi:nicotinate-nucleotide adenylyltransferase
MRLGIFGGTFDPVHLAHLVMADQCREQARLDQVLFIPAPRPPHKREQPVTPFAQRVEMLGLAISGQPAFRIDELERDRPGPSYTADTLQELKERDPAAELCLIVGSDSLHDLPVWYEPARILELATLLVVARPGSAVLSEEALRANLKLPAVHPVRVQRVDMPLLEIASRDIRRRLTEGRSVRYLIPRAVEAYIADKGLYGTQKA